MARSLMAYTLPLLISLSVVGAFSADSAVLRASPSRGAVPAVRKPPLLAEAPAARSSKPVMTAAVLNTFLTTVRSWGGKYGPDNILGIPSLVPCIIFFSIFCTYLTGVLATMQGAWIGAFKLIYAGAIAGVISRTVPQTVQGPATLCRSTPKLGGAEAQAETHAEA